MYLFILLVIPVLPFVPVLVKQNGKNPQLKRNSFKSLCALGVKLLFLFVMLNGIYINIYSIFVRSVGYLGVMSECIARMSRKPFNVKYLAAVLFLDLIIFCACFFLRKFPSLYRKIIPPPQMLPVLIN